MDAWVGSVTGVGTTGARRPRAPALVAASAVTASAFSRWECTTSASRQSPRRVSRAEERDSQIKVFDVEVMVEGSHTVLKPGMTVRCEYLVADLEDALLNVPSDGFPILIAGSLYLAGEALRLNDEIPD